MGLNQKPNHGLGDRSSTRINISEEFNKTNIWRQVNDGKSEEKPSLKSNHNADSVKTMNENQRKEESYQQQILKNTQP